MDETTHNAFTPFVGVPVSYWLSREASLSLQLTETCSSLKGGRWRVEGGREGYKKGVCDVCCYSTACGRVNH